MKKKTTSGTLISRRIETKNVNIIHKWLKGSKCQYYAQVVERLKMSILYTSGQQVKNVNIIHKWIKISTLCTSGQQVKNVNIMHKWLKG